MRKITNESVRSFLSHKTFNKQNMSVEVLTDKTLLKLHNNTIAILWKSDLSLWITNCGWFSNTTKERLNGLINMYYGYPACYDKGISQKNFEWFLNGEIWDGSLIELKK